MGNRRQRGEGSVFQRGDGKWVGVIDLGYVDGKRKRKTIYGPTQEAVGRKVKALRRQLDEHGDLPTSDPTVAKWLTYWLEEIAAPRVKPATLRSYRVIVDQYLSPSLGKHRLSRLAAQHVRQMHRYVLSKGCSSTTARNAHRVLSAALNDAVRDGKVGGNVIRNVRAPAKAVSTRTGLTADAAKVLLAAAGDDRLSSRWWAAFLLGLRQGERLGLRWSHVDLENGLADIAWSLQRVGYAHGCPKQGDKPSCGKVTRACPQRRLPIPAGMEHQVLDGNLALLPPKTVGSRRVVPLPAPMLAALKLQKRIIDSERSAYAVDHDLVWCRPDGRPIHPHDDWLDWRALLVKAEVPLVTLHEARHTTATLLLENGVDPHVVQQILGHSSIITTRGYQHVSTTLARGALDDLGRMLELSAVDGAA